MANQFVVVPVFLELGDGRMFAAGDFQRHLHRAVVDVVVVLHAAAGGVPGRSVGDAVGELFARFGFAAGVATRHAVRHGDVIGGVDAGQVPEDVVVRRPTGCIACQVDGWKIWAKKKRRESEEFAVSFLSLSIDSTVQIK